MKVCSWCEGRGVVGRLVKLKGQQVVSGLVSLVTNTWRHRYRAELPVAGAVVDMPCGTCGGTGQIAETAVSRTPLSIEVK